SSYLMVSRIFKQALEDNNFKEQVQELIAYGLKQFNDKYKDNIYGNTPSSSALNAVCTSSEAKVLLFLEIAFSNPGFSNLSSYLMVS
ncbi:Type III restriction protein res subunit, partial [human gut metagenome]